MICEVELGVPTLSEGLSSDYCFQFSVRAGRGRCVDHSIVPYPLGISTDTFTMCRRLQVRIPPTSQIVTEWQVKFPL